LDFLNIILNNCTGTVISGIFAVLRRIKNGFDQGVATSQLLHSIAKTVSEFVEVTVAGTKSPIVAEVFNVTSA
jgi:hypothetical protein